MTDYDPVTESAEVETLRQAVYAESAADVRFTEAELRRLAAQVKQTIDGQFVGVPPESRAEVGYLVDVRAFAASTAQLLINAVDSSLWIVVSRSPVSEALRRRFRDVREVDRMPELGYRLGI